ncbi:branched-chain amino acid ABC transporter permease [Haloplanus halobius]|uniref:branched-chain amino acid ABC transporter permease n=1 Tax=Haloplanus halobius TaxID=2934938 RepID=UPI00201025B1|nr:branched-chain amino acid ABC transporter permease [Haloplanus sp. XH21]
MIDFASIISQTLFATSILIVAALGLAIIFGMMGVINLAHGALITAGAYVAYAVTSAGLSIWAAFLIAPVVVALVGLVMERTVINRLYDRPVDTLLATWGFALVIQELIKVIFGTSAQSVPNPYSAPIEILGANLPRYRIFLTALAAALLVVTYATFKYTDFGVKSRAVIQNDEMAGLLGTDVRSIYMWTFMIGAGLAGLAGAAVAPIVGADPRTGLGYLVQSFFVVIVGGTGQLLAGTLGGAGLIGGSAAALSFVSSQTFAQTVVFALAIVVIRLKPEGLFGGT